MKNFGWRVAIVCTVLVVGLVFLIPSVEFYSKPGDEEISAPTKENTVWPHRVFTLGLDLQGGMHLDLQVQAYEAVQSLMQTKLSDMQEELRRGRIRHKDLEIINQDQIEVRLLGAEAADEFTQMMDKEFPELVYAKKQYEGEDLYVVLDLPPADKDRIMKQAGDQALEILRTRVDKLGLTEPDIRKQGDDRILLQLPGVKDPEKVRARIGTTARLEFQLVDEDHKAVDYDDGRALPRGSEILPFESRNRQTGRVTRSELMVERKTLLTGDYITDAKVEIDNRYGYPYVALEFNRRGAQIFERITEKNVGKRLAIVLDGVVKSAPVIKTKITGGQAVIEGDFSDEEAKELVLVLKTALPASVKINYERTVGPSLGADSVRMGTLSMVVGGVLVLIFMLLYYNGSGLVADLAVVLNVFLIAAGLSAFQATLTLPGIAGIILTIGMAVDANILIFERIREELRLGKTPAAAVDAGYSKATLTILDANVTTLVAALVLFQFGTGPVKGFAVTLSLGIVSSLFTAIVVTRVVFDYFLFHRRVKKLSI